MPVAGKKIPCKFYFITGLLSCLFTFVSFLPDISVACETSVKEFTSTDSIHEKHSPPIPHTSIESDCLRDILLIFFYGKEDNEDK